MEEGEKENDFNELKARTLVYYLLEKDINSFKKLIPEIRAMDSDSFKNLFEGIPFKSNENADGFEYKVKNKKLFEALINKFDNFFIILDSWYTNDKYYSYIKELWINYISIENLLKINEKGCEELLSSYKIDYNKWPEDIKSDFKKVIRSTTKTRIFVPEKVGEIEDVRNEFKYLLKEMYKFKKKIETEPEMITYERNIDRFISKLKTILRWLKRLSCGKTGIFMNIIGGISLVIGGYEYFEQYNSPNPILNTIHQNELREDLPLGTNNNDNLNNMNNNNLEEILENPNILLYIYSALSFIQLGWSVYEFYNTYNDLEEIKKNIKGETGYETTLERIINNFNIHKEKIGILPDDFKESLKIIKETFKEICKDYNELESLINIINKDISLANEHKNKSTIGLITSAALGIGGGILARNSNLLLHGISLASNVITGICHTIIIIDSKVTIKKLDDILNKANKQKGEIKANIDDLIKIISDLEKGFLPKFEKKYIVKYE